MVSIEQELSYWREFQQLIPIKFNHNVEKETEIELKPEAGQPSRNELKQKIRQKILEMRLKNSGKSADDGGENEEEEQPKKTNDRRQSTLNRKQIRKEKKKLEKQNKKQEKVAPEKKKPINKSKQLKNQNRKLQKPKQAKEGETQPPRDRVDPNGAGFEGVWKQKMGHKNKNN